VFEDAGIVADGLDCAEPLVVGRGCAVGIDAVCFPQENGGAIDAHRFADLLEGVLEK
jgi:hypothetical protein